MQYEYQIQEKNKFNDWEEVGSIILKNRNDNHPKLKCKPNQRIELLIQSTYPDGEVDELEDIIHIK